MLFAMLKRQSSGGDFVTKDTLNYTQNRELSWLRFNQRVLEEAQDLTVPLLERMKFVAIFTSNLDEFFMIRVGSLYDMVMMDDKNCIRCYQKSFTIQKKDLYDTKYVSLLALEPVKNLNIKGMKYEAGGMDLDILSDIGVSNEITEDTAAVSFDKGCLLLIASKD